LRGRRQALLGVPRLNRLKSKRARRGAKGSNKRGEQTNIKRINLVAQHQRHHPVVLEAQISKHKCKSEVRTNCGLLLNETQEQNS
jgi:hypothetical protein